MELKLEEVETALAVIKFEISRLCDFIYENGLIPNAQHDLDCLIHTRYILNVHYENFDILDNFIKKEEEDEGKH